jgi:hypothetical protein
MDDKYGLFQDTQQGEKNSVVDSRQRRVTDCESGIGDGLYPGWLTGLDRSGCYWETFSGAIGLGKKKRRWGFKIYIQIK